MTVAERSIRLIAGRCSYLHADKYSPAALWSSGQDTFILRTRFIESELPKALVLSFFIFKHWKHYVYFCSFIIEIAIGIWMSNYGLHFLYVVLTCIISYEHVIQAQTDVTFCTQYNTIKVYLKIKGFYTCSVKRQVHLQYK